MSVLGITFPAAGKNSVSGSPSANSCDAGAENRTEAERISAQREKKKYERELKKRRADLEQTINTLNTECRTSFSNPDKHLRFAGVIKVIYSRNLMDEMKSVFVNSDMSSLEVVDVLVEKFGINTHLGLHSLYEVDVNGDSNVIADDMSPFEVMIHWGPKRFMEMALHLRVNTTKIGQRHVSMSNMEDEAVSLTSTDCIDLAQRETYLRLVKEVSKMKELAMECGNSISNLIAMKEKPCTLKASGQPLLMVMAGCIKTIVRHIVDRFPIDNTSDMCGVVNRFRTNITDDLKHIIIGFKANSVDPTDTNCAKVMSSLHELKSKVLLVDQLVLGILYTTYIIESTDAELENLNRGQNMIMDTPHTVSIALMRYVGLAAKVVITKLGDDNDETLIEVFLRAIKRISVVLKSSPDYMLKKDQIEVVAESEKLYNEAVRSLIVAIKLQSGFWPPTYAKDTLIVAALKVVIHSCGYLQYIQHHHLLHRVKFDASGVLDEDTILRSLSSSSKPSQKQMRAYTHSPLSTQGFSDRQQCIYSGIEVVGERSCQQSIINSPSNEFQYNVQDDSISIPTVESDSTPPSVYTSCTSVLEEDCESETIPVTLTQEEKARENRRIMSVEMEKHLNRIAIYNTQSIPLQQESSGMIESFSINRAVSETLGKYLIAVQMEVDAITALVEAKEKEKYKAASEKLFNVIQQTLGEVHGLETSALDEKVRRHVSQAGYSIHSITHKIAVACMISTGVWPPTDSDEKFLAVVKRAAEVIDQMAKALKVAVHEQKLIVEMIEIQAREVELKRAKSLALRTLKICMTDGQDTVLRTASSKGLPKDIFDSLLSFPRITDIVWDGERQDFSSSASLPRVIGGSIKSLVLRLTFHEHIDPEFNMAFLLTMSSFATPHEFMDELIFRFKRETPPGINRSQKAIWKNDVAVNVKLRIFNSLKQWITLAVDDFQNDTTLKVKFDSFVELIARDLPSAGKWLKTNMTKCLIYGADCINQKNSLHRIQTSTVLAPRSLCDVNIKKISNILDIDSLEVARQLTMIEWDIYKRIRPKETMGLSWNIREKQHLSRNILGMINRANDVAIWVATLVLSQSSTKKRVIAIKYLILLAEHCLELNNFNALFTIVASISSSSITRLKKTWEDVPEVNMTKLGKLKELVSDANNYKLYRQHLHGLVDVPCIPFLGIYLTDLTFIEEGNPNRLPCGAINFNKRRIFAGTITQILEYQKHDFNFTIVNALHTFLSDLYLPWNEDSLYKQSLVVEPRKN
eukprot:CFRG3423T1